MHQSRLPHATACIFIYPLRVHLQDTIRILYSTLWMCLEGSDWSDAWRALWTRCQKLLHSHDEALLLYTCSHVSSQVNSRRTVCTCTCTRTVRHEQYSRTLWVGIYIYEDRVNRLRISGAARGDDSSRVERRARGMHTPPRACRWATRSADVRVRPRWLPTADNYDCVLFSSRHAGGGCYARRRRRRPDWCLAKTRMRARGSAVGWAQEHRSTKVWERHALDKLAERARALSACTSISSCVIIICMQVQVPFHWCENCPLERVSWRIRNVCTSMCIRSPESNCDCSPIAAWQFGFPSTQ